VAASQVVTSLVAFIAVYGLLGLAGYYLIARKAAQGPEMVEEA
jgi:cytochrome d ubiquinol oxidase subunit I